jgi:hypothetical protein
MKSVMSLSVIAAISFGLAACNSGSKSDNNSAAEVQVLSASEEAVHCENVEVVSMLSSDKKAKEVKMKYETLIDSSRSSSKDGEADKISEKGTKTFKVYVQNKEGQYELSSSSESQFESENNKTSTILENGDVKEVGSVKVTTTSGSDTQHADNSYEEVTRTTDGIKKVVYKLLDGVEMPYRDIEISEKEENGVKTISSVLKTPFTENSNGVKNTTESIVSTCTVSKK